MSYADCSLEVTQWPDDPFAFGQKLGSQDWVITGTGNSISKAWKGRGCWFQILKSFLVLDKLNCLKFNRGKWRVLHLRKNNPSPAQGTDLPEISSAEKGLSVLVDSKLSMSQQCPGWQEGIWESIASLSREVQPQAAVETGSAGPRRSWTNSLTVEGFSAHWCGKHWLETWNISPLFPIFVQLKLEC